MHSMWGYLINYSFFMYVLKCNAYNHQDIINSNKNTTNSVHRLDKRHPSQRTNTTDKETPTPRLNMLFVFTADTEGWQRTDIRVSVRNLSSETQLNYQLDNTQAILVSETQTTTSEFCLYVWFILLCTVFYACSIPHSRKVTVLVGVFIFLLNHWSGTTIIHFKVPKLSNITETMLLKQRRMWLTSGFFITVTS